MLEPIKKPVKSFDVVDLIVEQEREAKYLVRQERKERYRESNENKRARDLDRRQKRKNKRSQAY